MNELGKKAGYLKGLMEGMDFSSDPAQGKLFQAMADLMENLSDRVEAMEELMDDLNDYVESIDDDLAELEGDRGADMPFADDDEDADEYYHDFEDGEDQLHVLGGKAEDDLPENALIGALCPECGKLFFVSMDDAQDARYKCPHCAQCVKPDPVTPENAPIVKPEN